MKFLHLPLLTILIFLVASTVCASPLEDIFKDRYQELESKKLHIQETIDFHEATITEHSILGTLISKLNDRYRRYEINTGDYYQKRAYLQLESLNNLKESLGYFNTEHGTDRTDISIDELKEEISYLREKIDDIDNDLFDLKIKTVEKVGNIPDWWKDS